ncbi:hypothetical protein CSW47_12940 [Thermus scotoductus]|uniref:Uncharacterized protein n=1 Tax=Thermus scotoductus TaxID=37636 RepID=A0A430R0Y4_THESC|nr:hypothetical protein [Thermus scotoductus]RTH00993.1 hypothetical protein CSW47_12940 [Thermus scotoductus]
MGEAEVEVDPLLCFTPPYRAELALLRELGLEENPKALVLALALYRGDPTSNETLARRALAHLPVFRNMPRLSPRAQAFLQAFEKALPSFLEQAKEEDSLFLLQGTKATAYPLEPQKGGPEVVHRSSLEAWKGRAPFTAQAILEGEIPSLRDFLRSQALLAALLTHPGDEYLGAKHRALKHKLPQSLLLDALKELHSPLGPLLVPERNLLREVEVPVPEASLLRWKEAFLEVSEEGLYFLAETRRGLYLALLPGRQVYLNRLDKALYLRTGLEA